MRLVESATWEVDIAPLVEELRPDIGITNAPKWEWYVLRESGAVVAGAAIKPMSGADACLRLLFVRRPYRTRGLATDLVEQIGQMLWSQGKRRMFASVLSESQDGHPPAMGFYVKRGFTVHQERKHGAMMVRAIEAARPEVRLSLAIMHLPADPHRRAFIPGMIRKLGGVSFLDAETEHWEVTKDPARSGPWPTARRAWLSSVRAPRATHHVVLQDDMIPCRDFILGLKAAIANVPNQALTLCIEHRSADRARAKGLHWVLFKSDIWGGLVLPSPWVMPCIKWLDANVPSEYPHDDRRISLWLMTHGHVAYSPVPNLVEHAPLPSTLGHGSGHFVRWFIGEDVSALSVDWSKGASDPEIAPSGFSLSARWRDVQSHYEKAKAHR